MNLSSCNNPITFYKFIVVFYVVLMSVQIIGIEGMRISPVKVAAMGCSPLIMLILWGHFMNDVKVLFYSIFYLVVLIICCSLSGNTIVWDRIIYRGLFLATFCCVYQTLYTGKLTIEYFQKLLVFLVCLYGTVFIIQNISFAVGIRQLLLINLYGAQTMVGSLKANVLAIEPSHAARILAFLYLGVVKLTEIMKGREMSLLEHYRENPYSTISFFITMLFMGSATAIIGFFCIMAHFVKRHVILYVLTAIGVVTLLNVDTGIEQLTRVRNVINAFFSDDVVSNLKAKEGSGASRIIPMVNTFTNLNLFSWTTWVGQGSTHMRTHLSMFSTQRIGDITDFGLFTYLCSLLFVYKCCIRKFFTIENLLFFIMIGYAVGSLYTCWCALIVCTAIKYYSDHVPASETENGDIQE